VVTEVSRGRTTIKKTNKKQTNKKQTNNNKKKPAKQDTQKLQEIKNKLKIYLKIPQRTILWMQSLHRQKICHFY
jgi:copper oxidase (laccase) domain-containing protein